MRNYDHQINQLQQAVGAAHAKLGAMGQATHAAAQVQMELERQKRDIENLAQALTQVKAQASGDPEHVRYIEQIPGRRIPFDFMVTIPMGAGVTAMQQQSSVVSQDGPFVAVARYATFQSALQYTVQDPETLAVASFFGRSYGRFRPIHSAWDLNDSQLPFQPVVGAAFPGTGAGIYASPTNHSSFRSMQFDGMIRFQAEGASFHRQNIDLPSVFYTQQINEAFPLGALDFFERGSVLSWSVTPLHTNNPEFGNVSGFATGGFYPFLSSQYDVHEGILDPYIVDQETDPATRLPNGILTIGFHGYRIIQPPGTVALR